MADLEIRKGREWERRMIRTASAEKQDCGRQHYNMVSRYCVISYCLLLMLAVIVVVAETLSLKMTASAKPRKC